MDKLKKEYQILKDVVARAYGLSVNENDIGDLDQIKTIAKAGTFEHLFKFQNIFDNINQYRLFNINDNQDIIGICYENIEVGAIYNRIANLYLITKSDDQTNVNNKKVIDDEWFNLYNGYRALQNLTSKQFKLDIYSKEEEIDKLIDKMDTYTKILYILNVYLSYFIRQIHDELFGVSTIERYLEDPNIFEENNRRKPSFNLV